MGIGDGRTAVTFNGTSSRADVFSAALATGFNGDTGTLLCWARAGSPIVWTGAQPRRIVYLYGDVNNQVSYRRGDPTYSLRHNHIGTDWTLYMNSVVWGPLAPTDWFHGGVTWDTGASLVEGWYQGASKGTNGPLGPFVGALTAAKVGSNDAGDGMFWAGRIAHVAVWDVVLTAAEISTLKAV